MSIRFAADTPMGLKPYDTVLRMTSYVVSATAAAIFPGDPVRMIADGNLVRATTVSTDILGVAVSFVSSAAGGNLVVYDHPDQLFVIQDDSDTSFATQTQFGLNYDFIDTAGDTTAGGPQSRIELDISSGTVAAAHPLRAMYLHPSDTLATTAAAGNQRKMVVRFPNHFYMNTTGI